MARSPRLRHPSPARAGEGTGVRVGVTDPRLRRSEELARRPKVSRAETQRRQGGKETKAFVYFESLRLCARLLIFSHLLTPWAKFFRAVFPRYRSQRMAKVSDLKLRYRIFMRAYRYRQFEWRPGALLEKPLSQSRIAVVTTAGFYLPRQAPFDPSIRGGDYSFREIPLETNLDTLQIGHRSDAFDHAGIESDKNLALPLDRLRELNAEGRIAAVAPRHYSFMGSILAPARLVIVTAPEVARRLAEDQVDGVFLTPV